MNKVVNFLEKNVQWLAIGLGGLYLLWMVWAYILNSSVKVSGIDPSNDLPPGEVDEWIKDHNARALQDKMTPSGKEVVFPTPEFGQLLANITNPKPVGDLPSRVYDTKEVAVQASGGKGPVTDPRIVPAVQVVQLPKLPAPVDIKESDGRANLLIPPQAPPGAPAIVQAPPQPTVPGQPVLGNDVAWVTVKFMIPVGEIAKEFTACKIPRDFKTSMLLVELVREEMGENGQWGQEKVVPTLTTVSPLPWPSGAKKNDYRLFADWASQHWPDIVQPPFYTFVKGDPWHIPGEPVVGAAAPPLDPNAKPLDDNAIRQAFNPEKPPVDMTTAEKQALQKYKQQKAKDAAAARKAAQPPRGGPPRGGPGAGTGEGIGPRGGGGPGGFAPNDPGRPTGRPRMPEDGGVGMGEGSMEGFAPPPNAPSTFPLPGPGEFDPRLWMDPKNPAAGVIGDIIGWAHDATAQPGKTYRYKVRYKMKNPVYGTLNVTKPKELAEQFALVSPDSPWTTEVRIPALTSFFVATVFGDSAKIEVYRWQAGETHRDQFTVKPGDAIGTASKGIDFATGFTVVDLRQDARGDLFVLLVDANGNLLIRDPKSDQNNEALKRMKQQVTQSQNAAGAAIAGGGAPGGH